MSSGFYNSEQLSVRDLTAKLLLAEIEKRLCLPLKVQSQKNEQGTSWCRTKSFDVKPGNDDYYDHARLYVALSDYDNGNRVVLDEFAQLSDAFLNHGVNIGVHNFDGTRASLAFSMCEFMEKVGAYPDRLNSFFLGMSKPQNDKNNFTQKAVGMMRDRHKHDISVGQSEGLKLIALNNPETSISKSQVLEQFVQRAQDILSYRHLVENSQSWIGRHIVPNGMSLTYHHKRLETVQGNFQQQAGVRTELPVLQLAFDGEKQNPYAATKKFLAFADALSAIGVRVKPSAAPDCLSLMIHMADYEKVLSCPNGLEIAGDAVRGNSIETMIGGKYSAGFDRMLGADNCEAYQRNDFPWSDPRAVEHANYVRRVREEYLSGSDQPQMSRGHACTK